MISALTIYGVQIPKTFIDAKSARHWAEHEGPRYGCARIVLATARGLRTIWRPATAEQVAA